jgi:hypothetical protein
MHVPSKITRCYDRQYGGALAVVNDTLLMNFKESVQPGGLKLCGTVAGIS